MIKMKAFSIIFGSFLIIGSPSWAATPIIGTPIINDKIFPLLLAEEDIGGDAGEEDAGAEDAGAEGGEEEGGEEEGGEEEGGEADSSADVAGEESGPANDNVDADANNISANPDAINVEVSNDEERGYYTGENNLNFYEGENPNPKSLPDMQKPFKIGVVMRINSVEDINEIESRFDANIDLQLSWRDPRLAFDPRKIGTDRKEIGLDQADAQLNKMWNPDIVISNLIRSPSIEPNIEPGLFIYSDGTVVYIQRIKGSFKTAFNLRAFPYDTEALNVDLRSNKYTVEELQFVQGQDEANESGIRDSVSLSGWDIKELTFENKTSVGWNGSFYPEFTGNMMIKRKPAAHLFVFAPLLLILVMPTITTLFLRSDVGQRLGAWAGAMLALVAMSFSLNLRYPALDSDSIVTQLLTIGFGYQTFMILLVVTLLNPKFSEKWHNPYFIPELVKALRWAIPLGFITLNVVTIMLVAYS